MKTVQTALNEQQYSRMPWVKIFSDSHKDMKQFLVDVDGLSLGELAEAAFEFCMENVEDFEKFLALEEVEDEDAEGAEENKQDEEEETDKEEE